MDQPSSIKLFKENNICYVWDEENEDWYFSIEDFILFLTDCANSDEYIEEMLSRDESLAFNWNTMLASGDYNHYESGENRQN